MCGQLNGMRRKLFLWIGLSTGLLLMVPAAVLAVPPTEGIIQAIDQDMYQHYLDDLLFTHPGDDRGFGPEHDLAMQNIFDTFESFGLTVYFDPFEYNSNTYYNVVAIKEGVLYPDEHFIVGAHYDSVNNPGADDNGSGTAGVMEIARVLSQYDFESTIVFIGFDREEQGLHGSEAYAVEHTDDNILGMISMDMIAFDAGDYAVDIYGRSQSDGVKNSLAQAVADYGQGLSVTMYGAMDASDHAPFEWEGFEACLIIEEWGNPYYHTPQDNVDMPNYIDYGFATQIVRSVAGWLVDSAVVVELCPGDVDGDGVVDVNDLLSLLAEWGSCGDACGPQDFNQDGDVNVLDLLALLAAWGSC